MNTTGLQKKKIDYVMGCIYTVSWDEKTSTETETDLSDYDKLVYVYDRLKNEAIYTYNMRRFKGNLTLLIADHFMGLPSWFNLAFENYKILEIGKEWGYDLSTEKKEDKFIANWFNMLATILLQQFSRYDIVVKRV